MSEDDQDVGKGAATAVDRFKLVYEPSPIVPPDGGYGWVVVAAACMVNLIADGVTYSFGILLSELFKSLNDTREDISWISSFLAGIPLLLGPVTSLLIDRYGCRAVTMAGGLISGLGFALIFVLPQETMLYVFSAGLLSGFGLSMGFMSSVVAVSFYFVEKRALATGLSVAGSGLGTVVFAYITRACIETYTWRGSFLVLGGILFNICVCGALYRPLEPDNLHEMKRMQRLYAQFQANSCGSSSSASPTSQHRRQAAANNSTSAVESAAAVRSLLSIPTYLVDELSKQQRHSQSPSSTNCCRSPDEKQLIDGLKLNYLQRLASTVSNDASATVHGSGQAKARLPPAGNGVIGKASTAHELTDCAHQQQHRQGQQQKQQQKQQKKKLHEQQQQDQQQVEESKRMSIVVCLPQQQQQQQQPQQQQSLNTASHTVRRQLFPVDRRYFMQHTRQSSVAAWPATIELWDSCPEFGRIQSKNQSHAGGGIGGGVCGVGGSAVTSALPPLNKLMGRLANSKASRDVKFLFTSWDYVFFLASNFLLYFWYDITYTFFPDHAKDIGLSNTQVSLIIAFIGVSNTIGQIVIGYIGDFPSVDTSVLYVACMSLTGVTNFLMPWLSSFASLLVYGVAYGFLVSANYSLCSIVIIDLFNLERLNTGYGFMMFFQGLANLLGPPVMGYMRDTDSNYDRAFIYSGIFVLASNLLILPAYRTIYRFAVDRCCCLRKSPEAAAANGSVVATAATAAADEEAALAVPLTLNG